jgi:hypothetical protein
MRAQPHCWPPAIRSSLFSVAARLVLVLLSATALIAAGCGSPKAAPAVPSPEVGVASVLQKDVPIFSEWVATLDGFYLRPGTIHWAVQGPRAPTTGLQRKTVLSVKRLQQFLRFQANDPRNRKILCERSKSK